MYELPESQRVGLFDGIQFQLLVAIEMEGIVGKASGGAVWPCYWFPCSIE